MNSNIRCIEMRAKVHGLPASAKLNSNIRCIEITSLLLFLPSPLLLNSNIRCIEMITNVVIACKKTCWIVTLDVLKLCDSFCSFCLYRLNSNIRCIEILFCHNPLAFLAKLNSNIRCIEIRNKIVILFLRQVE